MKNQIFSRNTNRSITGKIKAGMLTLVLMLAIGNLATAQVVVDATSTVSTDSKVTSLTVSHTTGTAANRLLLVGVSDRENAGLTVTYDGDPLEEYGHQVSSTNARTHIFYMVNPPSGTFNVVVTATSNNFDKGCIVGVMTFSGVDQNTPLNTYTGLYGSSTNPTLTNIPTAANELVFNVVALRKTNLTGVGTNQTSRWNIASGDDMRGGGSTKPGPGTTTSMSWTSASGDWSMSAVSIKPVAIADLSVNLAVSENGPYLGEEVTYTVTATNNGPNSAPNVVINLNLCDGFSYVSHTSTQGTCNVGARVWDVGTLANGASATATITMVTGTSSNYTSTAVISGDVIDNVSTNNTSSQTIVICQAGGTAPLFNN